MLIFDIIQGGSEGSWRGSEGFCEQDVGDQPPSGAGQDGGCRGQGVGGGMIL